MNLPGAISSHDDVVRGREEVGRLRMLAHERAEDELRHRHVGRRVDAVARHVAEHDREPPILEREEVVDVAADVQAGRGLVHLADLQPVDARARARQQRALHRVGEVLLLLVEAGVVDREGRLGRECRRRLDRLLRERVAGAEGEDAERRDELGRQGERGRRPPSSPSRGTGQGAGRNCSPRAAGVEPERAPLAEERLDVGLERDGCVRIVRTASATALSDMDSTRYELLASVVGHPYDGGVDVEQVDDGARERIEGLVERETLSEGARDLVERP